MSDSWTIKGVSQKTKDTVRNCAAHDNMTTGAWVEQALKQAIKHPASDQWAYDKQLLDLLQRIDQRLARIEHHQQPISDMMHQLADQIGMTDWKEKTYVMMTNTLDKTSDSLKAWWKTHSPPKDH